MIPTIWHLVIYSFLLGNILRLIIRSMTTPLLCPKAFCQPFSHFYLYLERAIIVVKCTMCH